MSKKEQQNVACIWSSKRVAEALGIKLTSDFVSPAVVIDSRVIQPGDLFVAIKGERFDGHQFVEDVLNKGAVAAIVSKIPEGIKDRSRLIIVNDCMQALYDLARFQRQHVKARYIAITGSVGKTSTKEMLKLALAMYGSVYATTGNLNNHIGVPLTLCNMPLHTEYAIIEMGMNHANEIALLSMLTQPHVAVISTVEAVHLEFFDSIQDIADAKAEICAGLMRDGTIILNADNPYYNHLQMVAKKQYDVKNMVSFGRQDYANIQLKETLVQIEKTHIEVQIDKQTIHYDLGCVGVHQVMNSLSVLAVVSVLGLDVTKAAKSLKAFVGASGRGDVFVLRLPAGGVITLINDSYNASPASIKAGLSVLAYYAGRKIAILGDMLELGETAPQLHAQLASFVTEQGIDSVIVVGAHMQYLYQALPVSLRGGTFQSSDMLQEQLIDMLQDGDVLLIKGSHGMKMHHLSHYLTHTLPMVGKD